MSWIGGMTMFSIPPRKLDALARGGPALPIELAAATLSLPEEVQPALEAMDREGLIQIRVAPLDNSPLLRYILPTPTLRRHR